MPEAQYRTYKSYAGFVVRGSSPVMKPENDEPHTSWAFFLLSRMEAANWGTVQNYDGAGMSAGPLHAIAVQPSSKQQGALWGLLADIFSAVPSGSEAIREMRDFLAAQRMQLTLNGELVDVGTAKRVSGESLRDLLSGPRGFVPATGPIAERAKETAFLFHRLFSAPETFQAQKLYTIKWLLRGQRDTEFAAYAKYSPTPVAPTNVSNFLSYATGDMLGEPLDLAMCVYHAFSVNAPAPAVDELRKAMTERNISGFAKKLIRGLGTRSFGRWKDTTDNTSRYDKTRLAVEKYGRWDPELVRELMPVNFG